MDIVNPSIGHRGLPEENAVTFKLSSNVDGWIVPNDEEVLPNHRSELDSGPYDAFDISTGSSSLDVVVGSGEAVVEGGLLARDVGTNVTGLPENEQGLEIHLGWYTETRDAVYIGLGSNVPSNVISIPIWTLETDGSGVINTEDNRDIGHQVNTQNNRYETDNGSGTKVDAAEVADSIAGSGSGDFLRSDQDDTMNGRLTWVPSDAEAWRVGGGTTGSSTRFYRGTGDFDMAMSWNAYWDDGSNVWRSIQPNEGHSIILFDSGTPGDITQDGIVFGAGAVNSNTDDEVSWSWTQMEFDGSWNFNGAELKDFQIENRDNRPSNPDPGQLIYRTDQD